jgi:hypothetical protein
MTALTSQVPAVIDYLVAQAKLNPLLGSASPPVLVGDGPPPVDSAYAFESQLWIGYDPDAEADAAAEATQDWPNMDQGRTLDEDASITCTAIHWSGDTTIKVHRDACSSLVGAVNLMLRGTKISGGPGDTQMGGLVFWSRAGGPYQWYPAQTTKGAEMRCAFRIVYKARLTAD